MKKIKKAIIPAAGLGTRFLPATKAMPKEMLPIVDKPTIQYIVEEAIESGIEEIIIVTGKGKRAIEDHFDHAFELEQNLLQKEKFSLLEKVQHVAEMVNVHYIRQKQPLGLGHAIWCARNFIGDEPFAVLLGDDIIQGDVPCIRQMMNIYEQKLSPVISVKTVSDEETQRYGIVEPLLQKDRLYEVKRFVEKPALGTAPSNLAIIGRYILTPEIFQILDRQEAGAGGEIQLTDAIETLNRMQRVFAYDFEGKHYDVGDKLGFIQTNLEFALQDPEMKEKLFEFFEKKLQK